MNEDRNALLETILRLRKYTHGEHAYDTDRNGRKSLRLINEQMLDDVETLLEKVSDLFDQTEIDEEMERAQRKAIQEVNATNMKPWLKQAIIAMYEDG